MRSAATSLAVLAAFAPSLAIAAPRAPSREIVPRFLFQAEGPFAPYLSLGMRASITNGRDDGLVARPSIRVYRALPEIVVGARPWPGVSLFVGGGAGPALVLGGRGRRARGRELGLAIAGCLGVRFTCEGVPFTAIAQAEGVLGQGAAVMLRLRVDFGAAR